MSYIYIKKILLLSFDWWEAKSQQGRKILREVSGKGLEADANADNSFNCTTQQTNTNTSIDKVMDKVKGTCRAL